MGFFSLSKKNFSLNSRKKYVTLTIESKENEKQTEHKHIDNNPLDYGLNVLTVKRFI